ncbi:MAG: hypothetical protein Altm1KO_39260 [Alteromonas macleodii]
MAALPAVNLTTEWTHLLPNVTKYRALEDDLIPQDIAGYLAGLINTGQTKTARRVIVTGKQHRLESALKDVALHIDEGDNRNVIMKNRTGTRWRLADQKRYISGQQSLF